MPLPLAEIAAAARIAYTVYDLGFSKYTSSQQEYIDFGQDISLLRDGLQEVAISVEHVNSRSPDRVAFRRAANSLDLTSFRTIVGDFNETLSKCDKLIRKNNKFGRDDHGFVHNIQWNSGLGKHVQYLRQRVSFHAAKINLVLVPLEFKMYNDISRHLDTVHADIVGYCEDMIQRMSQEDRTAAANMRNTSFEVPAYLEDRFVRAATSSGSIDPFPLDDGMDALALHLSNSTQTFVSRPPLLVRPDPCQYINLMKSIWLVQKVRQSHDFETRCLDVLWGAYFRQMLKRVKVECRRFTAGGTQLRAPDEQQIQQEPEDKFEIWVTFDEVDELDDPTEPQAFESFIFRASLPEVSGRTQEIAVLRVNAGRIRLVQVLRRRTSGDTKEKEFEIDSQRVLLLPFYGFPDASVDALSFGWKAYTSDHRMQTLTFRRLSDVHKLQEAITNFGVVADQAGVTDVQIKASSWASLKSVGSVGRAQVWVCRARRRYEQPAGSPQPDPASPQSRQNSTVTSSSDHSGRGRGGWARSYAASTNPSTNILQSGNKSLLERPIPAQLVIFTKTKKGLKCFIAVSIDDCTRLSPQSCLCSTNKGCKKIVIKSDRESGVAVKIYTTMQDRGDQWNLAVLGHPEHEDARKSVEQYNAKFIAIEFDSIPTRMEIMDKFDHACCLMRHRVDTYHKDQRDSQNRNVAR